MREWFRRFKYKRRVLKCEKELENRRVEPMPHGLDRPLIVSLTSFPDRFQQLELTLKCLLKQSIKPDAVILWIAHEDIAKLGKNILSLRSAGLEIRACDDLKSFKKIIPALEEDPDRFIVTADDDVYYRADWLEALIKAANESSRCVVAHRAHKVKHHPDGSMKSYEDWESNIHGPQTGNEIFSTGVGGVLYPPGVFANEVTDRSLFTKLCPTADDIWLYWMVRSNGRVVRHVGPKTRVLEWPGSQEFALRNTNRGSSDDNGNDRAIQAMMSELGPPGANSAP